MKKIIILALFALTMLSFSNVLAQEPEIDRVSVPLTDPSRPVTLEVGLISGSITVKGYDGKEVIVEAVPRYHDYRKDKESKAEKGGLKRIPNTSSGLTVEEQDNVVEVSTGWRGGSRTTDVTIRVPMNCSMKLSTVNEGNILVENVNGDLEVNNTNGKVTLNGITGSAVAHALNGDLVVHFNKVTAEKPMSFSSLNGKIDVTLPADIKASVMMKSDMGEIYSDFDLKMDRSFTKKEDSGKTKGKYHVSIEKTMKGTINGGGQEIQFNNFNGDIYIRKGK